jgi:hypothetical protein
MDLIADPDRGSDRHICNSMVAVYPIRKYRKTLGFSMYYCAV